MLRRPVIRSSRYAAGRRRLMREVVNGFVNETRHNPLTLCGTRRAAAVVLPLDCGGVRITKRQLDER